MAQVTAGVDVGSVALLIALVLYQLGARRAVRRSDRRRSGVECAYVTLVLGLASSVLVGTFLAGALPGQ
jgi:hypothetical protein